MNLVFDLKIGGKTYRNISAKKMKKLVRKYKKKLPIFCS